MLKLIVTALILVMVFYEADSFAFAGPLKEETNDSGEVVKYCEDNDERHEIGETWINNCVQCNCGESYMECYGIGYNAGTMSVEGCSMVQLDDCCYQFFQTDDPSVPCFDKQCPAENKK